MPDEQQQLAERLVAQGMPADRAREVAAIEVGGHGCCTDSDGPRSGTQQQPTSSS